ncbi:MAG: hypothetical protein R3C01_13130 [Planctomycetaceae bacterium]
MKNKKESSANSQRGNPSGYVYQSRSGGVGSETTGSLSRPGSTAAARAEQPALSRRDPFQTGAALHESNTEPANPTSPEAKRRTTLVCRLSLRESRVWLVFPHLSRSERRQSLSVRYSLEATAAVDV